MDERTAISALDREFQYEMCLYGSVATRRRLYVPLFAGTGSGFCVYDKNGMGAMRESLRISKFLGPLLVTIITTPT